MISCDSQSFHPFPREVLSPSTYCIYITTSSGKLLWHHGGWILKRLMEFSPFRREYSWKDAEDWRSFLELESRGGFIFRLQSRSLVSTQTLQPVIHFTWLWFLHSALTTNVSTIDIEPRNTASGDLLSFFLWDCGAWQQFLSWLTVTNLSLIHSCYPNWELLGCDPSGSVSDTWDRISNNKMFSIYLDRGLSHYDTR